MQGGFVILIEKEEIKVEIVYVVETNHLQYESK